MNTYETIALELEDKKDNDYVKAVRLHNQEAKRRRLAEELARYDLVVEADRLANLYFHNFEDDFAKRLHVKTPWCRARIQLSGGDTLPEGVPLMHILQGFLQKRGEGWHPQVILLPSRYAR